MSTWLVCSGMSVWTFSCRPPARGSAAVTWALFRARAAADREGVEVDFDAATIQWGYDRAGRVVTVSAPVLAATSGV